MTKNRIVTWDTDCDITDLVDDLNDAMASVFDGRQCPRMTAVDTGSETYAVIVSSNHITDTDAQKVWDDTMREVGFRRNCFAYSSRMRTRNGSRCKTLHDISGLLWPAYGVGSVGN